MIEPLPTCEENPFFSTSFAPHLTLPGFFPGTGGFFHGHPNTSKRILIFGTDFGQLDYQQGLASTGGEPPNNATISNLSKILTTAGVSLNDCFLTNSVLCTWKKDSCIGNHEVWRKYPNYIADCAAWHRSFVEQHKPLALVLMGIPALKTFGKVLYPDLGKYWKGMSSLKAVYAAQRESFQAPNGPFVLLMPHTSFWGPNAARNPQVAATAIRHLSLIASQVLEQG